MTNDDSGNEKLQPNLELGLSGEPGRPPTKVNVKAALRRLMKRFPKTMARLAKRERLREK
jgi:hypothetical protein